MKRRTVNFTRNVLPARYKLLDSQLLLAIVLTARTADAMTLATRAQAQKSPVLFQKHVYFSIFATRVLVVVLSGFCFTIVQNSFVRPTTWSYPYASALADAARPTHRPHARTPLTRVRTHNSQCNSFESWPKSKISSLGELRTSHRPLGATVHAQGIACMVPFSGWQAASWLGCGRRPRHWQHNARAAPWRAGQRRW